jgi:uncharacterized Rossmann fold enzyme
MDFAQWEPIYREILRDFGWKREKDEEAALLLSSLLKGRWVDLAILKNKIMGKDILVCGKAAALSHDLDKIETTNYTIIAADGATSVLLQKGITPDIIVTDLDGNIPDEVEANRKGSLMVVHAHGDNMDKLDVVTKLKNVIGTTQSVPLSNVYNFGGFSDGDRCVFLAHEFGAGSIKLAGFDLEDKNVGEIKKKKFKWAKKLIEMIAGVIN